MVAEEERHRLWKADTLAVSYAISRHFLSVPSNLGLREGKGGKESAADATRRPHRDQKSRPVHCSFRDLNQI